MVTKPSKFKPFQLITKDETKKVVIVAGHTQVCPYEFDNVNQAEKYLHEQPYEMCINLISVLLYYQNQENNEKEQKTAN